MKKIYCYDINYRFLTSSLSAHLLKKFGNNIPAIVCIGSDKVLSDMVGVFVADKLKRLNINTYVFGGSEYVITTKNIDLLIDKIKNQNILFVDSAVSNVKNKIYFNMEGIKLKNKNFYNGASVCAGTIFYDNNKIQLANTTYKQVKNFANIIVLAITDYLSFLPNNNI